VAVLVVLGAFAIGAAVWTESYQPLVFGYGEQLPQGAVAAPAGNSYSVKFRDGRPFEFGVEVRNSGAFAVRILGVPRPGVLPFSARLYVSRPLVGGGLYGPYSLFRPFDLQPGEVRLLLLRGVYANCHDYSGGTGVALSVFPVRFSFLWNTDTAQIPLPEELAIEMPEGRRCLR
jgi:hypothetical protein